MSSEASRPEAPRGSEPSGRKGSWTVARAKERNAIDPSVLSDPKYKKYSQQVERCLTTFENMHEWADFIAFLKQLLKTLQTYTQFKEIPRKALVAKRLSQCLNPALPSGVHQRALDVYTHILATIGPEGLLRDLQSWSSGLFPFFEYAATAVRPNLLGIFETYYLPLQRSLRPIMKSFILALLPGLEEENEEYFERVMSLLDQVSGTVSPSFFFQNMWLTMLTNQTQRAYALSYLSRRLPRLDSQEDFTPVVGNDIGLMIRAFSAALEDNNLLVRRGALDLLVNCLRTDGAALKKASSEDRTILMNAAISVVLRRDLSLNRRLYTWLLGPHEQSEKQMVYLKENALDLLHSCLRTQMYNFSSDYSATRPFKIFVSLLDKWEIGSLLTEVLIYDALLAIQHILASGENEEDMIITANTLYDAVEPYAIWKRLFSSVRTALTGQDSGLEAISLCQFILTKFRLEDPEVQTIHLPLIFCALLDMLVISVASSPSQRTDNTNIVAVLNLLKQIFKLVPFHSLITALKLPESSSGLPYHYAACQFYRVPNAPNAPEQDLTRLPYVNAFENLVTLSQALAQGMLGLEVTAKGKESSFQSCTQAMLLLCDLVQAMDSSHLPSYHLVWSPKEWVRTVLACLRSRPMSFTLLDRIVTVVIVLSGAKSIQPSLNGGDREVMTTLVKLLLGHLRPDRSACHVRAVQLMWALYHAAPDCQLESIIAEQMNTTDLREKSAAFEAFGVLWRLTDDVYLPGFRFRIPIFIVLDSLKGDNPRLQRMGETWLRTYLKSYIRVLDPILFELLDPSIARKEVTRAIKGREVYCLVYNQSFDQSRMSYFMSILLRLVEFGGQGFSRVAQNSTIQQSTSETFVRRVSKVNGDAPATSYMTIIIELLLRTLQCEPVQALAERMDGQNIAMQYTAIDLLQIAISRCELDIPTLASIETVVIGKLLVLVHSHRLDLQNKLLHLLHTILSSRAEMLERHKTILVSPVNGRDLSAEEDLTSQSSPETNNTVNPLLFQTLVDGISIASNRPLMQHWLDFTVLTMSQFSNILGSGLPTLSGCICQQLYRALGEVREIISRNEVEYPEDFSSLVDDAEVIMLLNALERLVLIGLPHASDSFGHDDGSSSADKGSGDQQGIFTYVSSVFSSDNTANTTEDHLTTRSSGYRALHEAIGVLYEAWVVVDEKQILAATSISPSLLLNRSRQRCRRVLERLFRVQTLEVTEAVVDYWRRQDSQIARDCAFGIIDFLTSSSQNVVHLICESVSTRFPTASDKQKKFTLNENISDTVLFSFLDSYLQTLEGPVAIQVWGRFHSLAKEVLSSTRDYKSQVFPMLSCATVLAGKIMDTQGGQERKTRKDVQETFSKLLDVTVQATGRTFDSGTWIKRSNKDSLLANGRDSPLSMEPKMNDSSANLSDGLTKSSSNDTDKIIRYLGSTIIPNLRRFLSESDKVAAACTNIVYYVLNPALKSRPSRTIEIDDPLFRILEEMTKVSAALKSWKATVSEAFNDSRFFNVSIPDGKRWQPITKALFDLDKTLFPELMGRITTTQPGTIFSNKEYEMLLRSLNLRRLSYLLFASEKNHFLAQLPSIQEKLVDILKNLSSSVLESEVYLCIRVLICRVAPHNLTSFWPVLLSELSRVFQQAMVDPPLAGSEELQIVLSACKLLDLLVILQTEEFQIHQWIFITDTVDSVYRPDDYLPEAMMDQLSEIANSAGSATSVAPDKPVQNISDTIAQNAAAANVARRPLLKSITQVESLADLTPFFSHISIASYENVYASGSLIDWDIVQDSIMEDMFDGR